MMLKKTYTVAPIRCGHPARVSAIVLGSVGGRRIFLIPPAVLEGGNCFLGLDLVTDRHILGTTRAA